MPMRTPLLVLGSLSLCLTLYVSGADFSGRNQGNVVGSQDSSLTKPELDALNDLVPKILYLDKLSEAAAQKSADARTKELANKVAQDYHNLRAQCWKIAGNHSFTYRDAPDLNQKQAIEEMTKLPAEEFDQKYRDTVASVSGEIADLLQKNRDKMHSEDIQKFMDGALSVVKAHAQEAQGVAGKA
jgi:predicted outer membrane protein